MQTQTIFRQAITGQMRTIFGAFDHVTQDASETQDTRDYPLWVMGSELPESFLNEEVDFDVTVGERFYTSDLANMWHDVVFMKALMKHPEAVMPLRAITKRLGIKVSPIQIRDCFHVLKVTDEYLFENQVDTVEDLVVKIIKKKMTPPSDVVRNDLDSAFRSRYGTELGLSA